MPVIYDATFDTTLSDHSDRYDDTDTFCWYSDYYIFIHSVTTEYSFHHSRFIDTLFDTFPTDSFHTFPTYSHWLMMLLLLISTTSIPHYIRSFLMIGIRPFYSIHSMVFIPTVVVPHCCQCYIDRCPFPDDVIHSTDYVFHSYSMQWFGRYIYGVHSDATTILSVHSTMFGVFTFYSTFALFGVTIGDTILFHSRFIHSMPIPIPIPLRWSPFIPVTFTDCSFTLLLSLFIHERYIIPTTDLIPHSRYIRFTVEYRRYTTTFSRVDTGRAVFVRYVFTIYYVVTMPGISFPDHVCCLRSW